MIPGYIISTKAEGDAAAEILERRWFASMAAARSKQAECEALLEVVALAKASWHDSSAQLRRLEVLRDALGEELAERCALREAFVSESCGPMSSVPPISSAA